MNSESDKQSISVIIPILAKMKLFQLYQRQCAWLGIHPIQSNKKFRLNWKMVIVYVFYLLNIMSNCVSMFVKASTFKEYTDYIYWLSVASCKTVSYTVMIYKTGKLFDYFEACDRIIEISK